MIKKRQRARAEEDKRWEEYEQFANENQERYIIKKYEEQKKKKDTEAAAAAASVSSSSRREGVKCDGADCPGAEWGTVGWKFCPGISDSDACPYELCRSCVGADDRGLCSRCDARRLLNDAKVEEAKEEEKKKKTDAAVVKRRLIKQKEAERSRLLETEIKKAQEMTNEMIQKQSEADAAHARYLLQSRRVAEISVAFDHSEWERDDRNEGEEVTPEEEKLEARKQINQRVRRSFHGSTIESALFVDTLNKVRSVVGGQSSLRFFANKLVDVMRIVEQESPGANTVVHDVPEFTIAELSTR
jgi:hypothetical protein